MPSNARKELEALRALLAVCDAVLSVPRVPTQAEQERAEFWETFYGTQADEEDDTDEVPNWRFVPHRYVPTGVPQWRTCKLCGIGANARIHKTDAETSNERA